MSRYAHRYRPRCEDGFLASELASYQTVSSEARRRCFFGLWTRKEARLKAAGLAMAHRYFSLSSTLRPLIWFGKRVYRRCRAEQRANRSEPFV